MSIDLSLTKVVDNPTPIVGDNVTFTITVLNDNAADIANGVVVKDLLPTGLSYVSDDSGGNYSAGTGLWNVGIIFPGFSATINITAEVTSSGFITNYAQIFAADESDLDSTPGDDSITEDDDDSVTIFAAPPPNTADLSLTKVVNDLTPVIGSNVTFTITVTNSGPGSPSSVTVKDLLPSGLQYVSDDGAGAYVPGTGVWTVGTISSGSSKSLNIVAKVLSSGSYVNYAQVFSSPGFTDPDSTPGDDSITEDDDDSVTLLPVQSCPYPPTSGGISSPCPSGIVEPVIPEPPDWTIVCSGVIAGGLTSNCCKSWKQSVRTVGMIASTTPGPTADLTGQAASAFYFESGLSAVAQFYLNLLTPTTPTDPVDGVTLVNGDRILLPFELPGPGSWANGIFDLVATEPEVRVVRSKDMDESVDVIPPMMVAVSEGDRYANTIWMLITNAPIPMNRVDLIASPPAAELTFSKLTAEPGTGLREFYAPLVSTSATATTTAEQAILPNPPLPQPYVYFTRAGDGLEIRFWGNFTTSATPPSLTVRVKVGGIVITTIVISPPVSQTSREWLMELTFILQDYGTGDGVTTGWFYFNDTDQDDEQAVEIQASPTITPTGLHLIEITAEWGSITGTDNVITSLDTAIYKLHVPETV